MSSYIPILFQTEMVEAILSGLKLKTRRPLKPQPIDNTEVDGNFFAGDYSTYVKVDGHSNWREHFTTSYAKWKVGDILWVRETFGIIEFDKEDACWVYKTDTSLLDTEYGNLFMGWKPSIHMPKEACRLFLEVTDVKLERIQDISEEDAMLEGVARETVPYKIAREQIINELRFKDYIRRDNIPFPHGGYVYSAKRSFEALWRKIYGDQSWDRNEWVFAISFKVVDRPTDFLTKESNVLSEF